MATARPVDPACVFCKIVAGELPCYELFQNERVMAFLDIGPLSRGHALVIPKGHYATLDRMPRDLAAACMEAVWDLSRVVKDVASAEGWNVLQNNGRMAGQEVPHVHFHIIPRHADDGLGYRWLAGKLSEKDSKLLQQEIRKHLAPHLREQA